MQAVKWSFELQDVVRSTKKTGAIESVVTGKLTNWEKQIVQKIFSKNSSETKPAAYTWL